MFNFFKNKNNRQKKIILRMIMNVGGCVFTAIILGIDYKEASKIIPRRDGRRP